MLLVVFVGLVYGRDIAVTVVILNRQIFIFHIVSPFINKYGYLDLFYSSKGQGGRV